MSTTIDYLSPAEMRKIIRRQKLETFELREHIRDLESEPPEPVHVPV